MRNLLLLVLPILIFSSSIAVEDCLKDKLDRLSNEEMQYLLNCNYFLYRKHKELQAVRKTWFAIFNKELKTTHCEEVHKKIVEYFLSQTASPEKLEIARSKCSDFYKSLAAYNRYQQICKIIRFNILRFDEKLDKFIKETEENLINNTKTLNYNQRLNDRIGFYKLMHNCLLSYVHKIPVDFSTFMFDEGGLIPEQKRTVVIPEIH